MALSAGTRLGPYEILKPLGAGGMGEVYRTRDTRLDRTVAVKILPAALAADPQLKDPDGRWDTAHDVAVRLREIAEADAGTGTGPRARGVTRWAMPAVAVLVVGALLVGVLAGRLLFRPSESPRAASVIRSEVNLPADRPLLGPTLTTGDPMRKELAVSPDGTLLAWTTDHRDDEVPSALCLRRLNTGEVSRLRGPEGASQPSFSPDGRWIAFSAWDQGAVLRKVSLEQGLTVDLGELSSMPLGVSWAADGKILLALGRRGIQWVSAEGGAPHEVTTVDLGREGATVFPRLS